MNTRITTGQDYSFKSRVSQAGLSHGGLVEADVVMGVTPSGHPRNVVAHGCSSQVRIRRVLRQGDGTRIDTLPCPVAVRGLPPIPCNAFVRATMAIESNGSLWFREPKNVRIVPIPSDLNHMSPWGYDDGAQDVAEEMGCATVEEMFEKFGEPVSV